MKIWLDAHLPPAICGWISETFDVQAVPARDVGMRDAEDPVFFEAARTAGVDAVMTKDRDFVDLLERLGPPPKLIWVTVGNTSNRNLKRILTATLRDAIDLLSRGESLVEISEQSP